MPLGPWMASTLRSVEARFSTWPVQQARECRNCSPQMDLCLRPTFLQMVNGFALRWAMRRRIRPHSGRLVETDQTRMLCWLIGSTAQPIAVGVGHPTADTTFFRRLRVLRQPSRLYGFGRTLDELLTPVCRPW